ncbi:MAG: carbohydrate-binding protein, partial [Fibrobacter sp.]|nr:carbohydrate-binding protein [Fibrobacter sp.]
DLPESPLPGYGMVTSDDFDSDVLPLEWQWNHNPDNKNWSLTANPGFLRITTGRTDSRIVNAKNTLTQRSFGPKSSGRTLVDGKGMKDGDMAGLVALQDDKGFVALAKDGGSYKVVMYTGNKNGESLKDSKAISGSKVYLRIDFDLPIDRGTAYFYYSTDGNTWTKIGSDVKLNYDLHMFVGVRWGLFNFATKQAGGYADFDWFKVGTDYKDEIYLGGTQDTTPPTPYKDVAAKIPGKVEVENYDVGKSNRAYYDTDGDNQGKAYREDPVDIVQLDTADKSKGYAIGYTAEGEWLRYTVNVAETGTYEVKVNMATPSENAGVKLYIDGKAVTDDIIAKQNGENDWSTYSAVSAKTKEIEKGEHALKVEIVGNNVNVDWLEFCKDECKTDRIQGFRYGMNASRTYGVYGIDGSFVGRVDASNAFDVRTKVNALVKQSGIYFVKSVNGGHTLRISVTK